MKICKMFLLIFMLISTPIAADEAGPIIKKIGAEYLVVLSGAMKKALQEYDPEFSPWRQSDYLRSIVTEYAFSTKQIPFAVIGDFNGDGKLDLVLHGHNKKHDLLISILSSDSYYKIVEIEKGPLTLPSDKWYNTKDNKGLWVYLTHMRPGSIRSDFEDNSVNLKTDAFQLNYYEKASVLYYFYDGTFKRYTTGD